MAIVCWQLWTGVAVAVHRVGKGVRHLIRHRSGHPFSHRAARHIWTSVIVCAPIAVAAPIIIPPILEGVPLPSVSGPSGANPSMRREAAQNIPEPSTILLLSMSVVGLVFLKKATYRE